jgi:hypothetical protein
MADTHRIETLARRLCFADGEHWEDLDESGRDFWRERAREELRGRDGRHHVDEPRSR